jgi:hypothetical protein
MYIPYYHDRVIWKATGTMCLVVFVDVHNRTADLFPLRGAGELIKGVPFLEVTPANGSGILKTA